MKKIINKLNLKDFLLKLLNDCNNIIFNAGNLSVSYKIDGSPVSNVDQEVDKYIKINLEKLNLSVPLISEEQAYNKEDFKAIYSGL